MNKSMLLLPTLLLSLTATVWADPIAIASSGGSNQTNNSLSLGLPHASTTTLPITKNPGWADPFAGSQWVSFTRTGDPSDPLWIQVANNTVVSFFDTFDLPDAPAYVGSLSVMADDSLTLYLNGQLLIPEAPGTSYGNTYTTCSDFAPGCLVTTTSQVDLGPFLRSGSNTLQFDVAQRQRSSYGLDYAGWVDTSQAPEPGSLLLLGSGILGLASVLRRRIRR